MELVEEAICPGICTKRKEVGGGHLGWRNQRCLLLLMRTQVYDVVNRSKWHKILRIRHADLRI